MKIGLLTVYSFNYGSYFQATSLLYKLKDMGHNCELINERFKEKQWTNLRLLYTFHSMIPQPLRKMLGCLLPQYNTFLCLQKDVIKLPQSPPRIKDMESLCELYDCIVLGSDEVWSASPRSIRYTPEYFGYNITKPHIAYAPCGSLFDLENPDLRSRVADGIKSFQNIAVRDVYTQEMVKKTTGREVCLVLDPTLLNPYFIKGTESHHGGYVLLYGSDYSEEQQSHIKRMAARHNWQIVALGWPHKWANRFCNPSTAGEFQDIFEHAAYCVPSTFHGTIFSILHKKQFVTMLSPLRGRKVTMLLQQLGLESRLWNQTCNMDEEIDYSEVNQLLENLRRKSEKYLEDALEAVSLENSMWEEL